MSISNFDDVGDFHHKFGLPEATYTRPAPRPLTREELGFRFKFLVEELREYAEATGIVFNCSWIVAEPAAQDLPAAFDALLDLAYVVFGTAHLHRFPWQEGWGEVQRANITKERCRIDHVFEPCLLGPPCPQNVPPGGCHHGAEDGLGRWCGQPEAAHSKRGSVLDVIKPPGWEAPNLGPVLARYGACGCLCLVHNRRDNCWCPDHSNWGRP